MKRALALIGAALLLALLVHAGSESHRSHKIINADNITHAQDIQAVQKVCDKAQQKNSGVSEQQCGQAEEATGTEYLCDPMVGSRAAIDATCWVEYTGER